MFAALYSVSSPVATLIGVAQSFSPRVEVSGRLVLCDLVGVARLFGGARDVAEHLRRALVDAGAVRVAVAPTHTAAALLALGRPGVAVAATADEARQALATLPVATLAEWDTIHGGPGAAPPREADVPSGWGHPRDTHQGPQTRRHVRGRVQMPKGSRAAGDAARVRATQALDVLRRWGIRTLGQYAALPAAELSTRLGPLGPRWQHAAIGHDMTPLVPLVDDEPFEASLALEWPVEGLEPLSFVLARVLEPLAARLERADRGAAVLHTTLHLTSRATHVRTLQLPAPMRDAKTLRTLILLDLESHPPDAAIDRVVVRVEPTPGRIVQWSLLDRAQPSPEQVSTLLARLTALMGESHVGSPQLVDSWRPGAFAMRAFSIPQGSQRLAASGSRLGSDPDQRLAAGGWRLEHTEHDVTGSGTTGSAITGSETEGSETEGSETEGSETEGSETEGSETAGSTSRQPLAASRYSEHPGRQPLAASRYSDCAVAFRRFRLPVPARVTLHDGRPVRLLPDRRGVSGGTIVDCAGPWRTSGHWWDEPAATDGTAAPRAATAWDRDEWDVVLADGASCRVYLEREVGQWFIEGTFD